MEDELRNAPPHKETELLSKRRTKSRKITERMEGLGYVVSVMGLTRLNAGMYDENGELYHQMSGQRIGIFIF